ncbi:hypothetical protein [Benzoatithermus flavus]|uniref:Uncharacterized protein n=1 Tax=Benzoatithermus flavus TaxID=3108223 RepID=A0ABU8XUL5_9PROT
MGEPDPELYRIAVKCLPESRGGSTYMWSLAPGARLKITRPENHPEFAFAAELRERIGDRLELFVSEEGRRIDVAAEIGWLAPDGGSMSADRSRS